MSKDGPIQRQLDAYLEGVARAEERAGARCAALERALEDHRNTRHEMAAELLRFRTENAELHARLRETQEGRGLASVVAERDQALKERDRFREINARDLAKIQRLEKGTGTRWEGDCPVHPTGVLCHICEKPAVCIGQYDNMERPLPACGECCGHGNEDGWCEPLNDYLKEGA